MDIGSSAQMVVISNKKDNEDTNYKWTKYEYARNTRAGDVWY